MLDRTVALDSGARRRGSRRAPYAAALLALLSLAATPALAQAETSASLQPVVPVTADGTYPVVALAPSGGGLVAWATEREGVMVRRLRAGGGLGPSRFFREVVADIRQVRAGADAAGGFILAWQEGAEEGTSFDILAQRLRPDGGPRGGVLLVNRLFAGDQTDPQLGVAPDGRFAVLFADGSVLRLARFEASGLRLGQPRRLPTAAQATPLTGGVAAGQPFLLAGWTELRGCDGSGEEIRAGVVQVPWGGPPADETSFGDGRVCEGGPVLVGLLASDFGPLAVLAGHNYNLQRFDPATGAPRGARTVFAELRGCDETSCEVLAAVAGDARGRFVAIWERRDFIGSDLYSLSVQLFGRDGRSRLEPIVVTDEPSARPTRPAAALAANGTLHVVWEHAGNAAAPSAVLLRTLRFDG